MRSTIKYSVLIPSLLFSLTLASCSSESSEDGSESTNQESELRTVRVESIVVASQPFDDMISLLGVVQSPNDVTLSAQSMGTLISRAPLGTEVAKGGIVARTDATLIEAILRQAKASLEAAEANSEFAEDTYKRQEPLYRDSIISALEFEQLRTQLNAARAQLTRARSVVAQTEKERSNTLMEAPFSGVVEEHFAEIGELISIGMPVIRIVDTRTLKIVAGVPERYARDIRTGTPVSIRFKAYGNEERSGTISFVGNVIDPQNRSFLIEINLDNSEGDLKPAMVADVFLARAQLIDQIVIPQTAILRDENGNSVYVIDRSSDPAIAQRKGIELGASFAGQTVVQSGLDVGDEVIIAGQTRVSEGDAVLAIAPAEDSASLN
jgi:membrane fusion protein (multidrug efflux system)